MRQTEKGMVEKKGEETALLTIWQAVVLQYLRVPSASPELKRVFF